MPEFKPVGPGAFRAWLRAIMVYRLQTHWRKVGRVAAGGFDSLLAGLTDPASELTQLWDEEHDRHVVYGLMAAVRPGFQQSTWQAFWRTAILEEAPTAVAADLRMSPNAVFIARSRVLQRLREQAAGLVDDI